MMTLCSVLGDLNSQTVNRQRRATRQVFFRLVAKTGLHPKFRVKRLKYSRTRSGEVRGGVGLVSRFKRVLVDPDA